MRFGWCSQLQPLPLHGGWVQLILIWLTRFFSWYSDFPPHLKWFVWEPSETDGGMNRGWRCSRDDVDCTGHPIKNVNQNRIMMTWCKCVTGRNQRCISSFEQILWFWCHETLNWCYQLCKYVVFGWRSTWTQKRDHCCRMAEYGGVGWGEDASTIGIIEVGLTCQRSWERLSNVKWSWPWTVFFFKINFVTSVHNLCQLQWWG